MYKDSKSTCTAIVLLIKPFVWRRSRCRRRRVLLKLPIIPNTGPSYIFI